jgi:hypothetical protein
VAVINKEDVLAALRSNDPGAKELVDAWTRQQEALVVTSKDTIVLNFSRADLYVTAGDLEGALECLKDALYQARQEGEDLLYEQIKKKLAELSR